MSSRGSGKWKRTRYPSAAMLALLAGIAPILTNILASQVVSWLGCYIAEYRIYSRAGILTDSSDDLPRCLVESSNVDFLLVGGHIFGIAIAFSR